MMKLAQRKIWKSAAVVVACCFATAAFAKLPSPPATEEAKAKAAEAKTKAEAAAKKDAENLAKSQDRAVANYKKAKGGAVLRTSTQKK